MRKLLLASFFVALIVGLPGCKRGEDSAKIAADAAAESARRAYHKQILDWRIDRIARLQKPDGWLSLVGLHWLEVGGTRVGSGEDNGTRLAVGPPHLGIVTLDKNGKVTFAPESGAGITINGEPASGKVKLVSDADASETVPQTIVGFNKGDASFVLIKRTDRYALRVRDALSPTRTGFVDIRYFDIDPAFRLKAKFVAHPPGQKIDIVNVISMIEPMDNPGTVTFEKDGKSFTLEAIDEGDHRLYLIFADRTSGHESYPAARYLYAAYPGSDGMTVVDFNEAYNPPCAFTAYATCPLPPLGNRLDLAITAGEKKPLKHPPLFGNK